MNDDYKAESYIAKVLAQEVIGALRQHLKDLNYEPSPERTLEAVISLMTSLGGVVADSTATFFTTGKDQENLRIELSEYILNSLECAWIPDRAEIIKSEIEGADNVIKFPIVRRKK